MQIAVACLKRREENQFAIVYARDDLSLIRLEGPFIEADLRQRLDELGMVSPEIESRIALAVA